MSREIKQRIISIMPLYLSKEFPAYSELIKAIQDIPDDKFYLVINGPRWFDPMAETIGSDRIPGNESIDGSDGKTYIFS